MAKIVSKVPVDCDGIHFPAGGVVADVVTEIHHSRLQSLISSGVVTVISDDDASPQQTVAPNASADDDSDDDSDDLGDDGQDESPLTTVSPSSDPNAPSDEQKAAIEFPGLKERIALALMAQGIANAEALKAYIAAEKDLTDLKGIGKAAVNEITVWSAAN